MLAILEAIYGVFTFVGDVILFFLELPSHMRWVVRNPVQALLWLVSAAALGVALAAWEGREDVGLAATLTAVGIGACALAIALARRRGNKLCDELKQTGTRG